MQHLPIHPSLRHPLTGEPIRAVGMSKRGPIWPIMGASEDPPADPAPSDDPPADPPSDPAPEDFEEKFNSQRTINRKLERESKPWFQVLKETGMSADEAVELIRKGKSGKPPATGGDPEPVDADQIRREAEQAAAEKANARLVRAEVRALAAEGFTNPTDALHNLNLDDFEVNEDGELEDVDAVKAALADVLKKNPHYAKKGRAPKPDPSQGPGGSSKPDPGPGMARLRQAYANTSK